MCIMQISYRSPPPCEATTAPHPSFPPTPACGLANPAPSILHPRSHCIAALPIDEHQKEGQCGAGLDRPGLAGALQPPVS